MNKFSDRLSTLGHNAPQRMGFGQVHERKRNPVMLVVGLLESSGKPADALSHVDIGLLRSKKGGRPASAVPDGAEMWGVSLSDCSPADLDTLKEAGCDFILIESGSAPGITLRDDDLARGFVLPETVTEPRAHAIEDMPFDFLLLRGHDVEWPLTLAQVLAIQEKVSMYSKHFFLELSTPPSVDDLPLLRDMPVSGLVFDLASQDMDKLDSLRKAISELEPRKPKSEHIALLPSNAGGGHTAPGREPDPDEGDDDDDD